MKRRALMVAALVAGGLLSLPAARAADKLHEMQSVEINASPDKVWGMIENFGDLTWVPPVKTSTATQGNTVGSVRTLDLGGPKLVEQLVSYTPAKHSYAYKITDDAANKKTLPVSNYMSTITVSPSTGTTSKVTWSGTFERADTSASPATGMDDAAAKNAVSGVYKAGLGGLKKKAEGG